MKVRSAVAAVSLLLLPACFGGSQVTETGKGLPQVSIDFPSLTEPGSTHDAVVTVTNPGPGNMSSLFISFSRVGVTSAEELPEPIVDLAPGDIESSVAAVDPEPDAISPDGLIYTFPGLEEGSSTTITFTLKMPEHQGLAANSVIVYDGQDVERARGAKLETDVRG